MAQGFRHTPHGYAARFEKAEFDLIRDLAEDVIALLESPDSEEHDPLEAQRPRRSSGGTSTAGWK